jgi:hypothetical protein
MPSLTILIIRHAEKPGESFPGPGLTIEGQKDGHSLVIRGWQRAGAWGALFGSLANQAYPKPDFVYAADPNEEPTGGHNITQRPYETIIPLCKKLGISPTPKFGVGDEEDLVVEVTGLAGTVLICWEHKKIGEAVLPLIAAGQEIQGLPQHWDSKRFDAVLRFDREGPQSPWQFHQRFPLRMDGDSDQPM